MSFNSRKIHVPMPQAAAYGRTIDRDQLVRRYGESTVLRAEIAAIMNLLMAVGMISGSEFVDLVVRQCSRIDEERRGVARLEEDRG
jgi:hypothetical protein